MLVQPVRSFALGRCWHTRQHRRTTAINQRKHHTTHRESTHSSTEIRVSRLLLLAAAIVRLVGSFGCRLLRLAVQSAPLAWQRLGHFSSQLLRTSTTQLHRSVE